MGTIMAISEPTVIICSECGTGVFEPVADEGMAECSACHGVIEVALDIERHMDPGERLVWLDRGAGDVLCYFTEEGLDR